jgi:hypothetical protein
MPRMTKSVRKMYKEAKANKQFKSECKAADPEKYVEPNMFDSEAFKICYASIYYGWLVARGEFNPDRFYS